MIVFKFVNIISSPYLNQKILEILYWHLLKELKFRRSVNGEDKDQLLDFVVKYFSANPINILFDAQGALLDTFNDICAGDGGIVRKIYMTNINLL